MRDFSMHDFYTSSVAGILKQNVIFVHSDWRARAGGMQIIVKTLTGNPVLFR
jgi:hypothetical protein